MTSLLTLAPVVRGNAYGLLHPVSGLTPGTTIASAICIVKQTDTAPWPVPGIAQKNLTTSFQEGIGQVINTGGAVPANTGLDGVPYATPATQPYIYVVFTPAETLLLVGASPYIVMVQLIDSLGKPYTSEISHLPVLAGLAG